MPLLVRCLPGEAGESAAFLPAGTSLRVRALSFEDAETALLEKQRHGERRRFSGVVALLNAVQSGGREKQELAVQKLLFPASHEDQPFAKRAFSDWLKSTPLSEIERAVIEDREVGARTRSLMLAAIRAVKPLQEPHRFFCMEVTRLLNRVRLVLWWDGKHFLPSLYCEDRTTALYLRVLLKASRGQGLATCLKCGTWFVQDRANQNYCSIAHREAHRVSRWRAQQKKKSSRKDGKHGARKTR